MMQKMLCVCVGIILGVLLIAALDPWTPPLACPTPTTYSDLDREFYRRQRLEKYRIQRQRPVIVCVCP